ncbi:MAG: hypothetical protein M3P39_02290 [Actinomycetota bacterium]|nr:hypothetical protein [Actinomycetota bacterium]
MATAGQVLSYGMSDRWAFEGLGRALEVDRVLGAGASPLGSPLLAQYGESFSRDIWIDWLIIGAMALLFLAGACVVLAPKCRPAGR